MVLLIFARLDLCIFPQFQLKTRERRSIEQNCRTKGNQKRSMFKYSRSRTFTFLFHILFLFFGCVWILSLIFLLSCSILICFVCRNNNRLMDMYNNNNDFFFIWGQDEVFLTSILNVDLEIHFHVEYRGILRDYWLLWAVVVVCVVMGRGVARKLGEIR